MIDVMENIKKLSAALDAETASLHPSGKLLLLGSQDSVFLKAIKRKADQLGINCDHTSNPLPPYRGIVVDAKHYGIPQNRERVYCVIIRKDLDNGKFKFPSPIPLKKALVDMLEDKVDERYYLSDDKVAAMITPPRSDKSVTPSAPAEEVPQTTTAGTCSLAGVKLSKKGTQFEGYCETALTLLARDYKGFGNQQMTGVMEHNE